MDEHLENYAEQLNPIEPDMNLLRAEELNASTRFNWLVLYGSIVINAASVHVAAKYEGFAGFIGFVGTGASIGCIATSGANLIRNSFRIRQLNNHG